MTADEFNKLYWSYYLTLEKDLMNVQPYITFEKGNYSCYSNYFIKIYQAICSEVDVIFKLYTQLVKEKYTINIGEKNNIDGYKKYILYQHDCILNEQVTFLINNDKFIPWKDLDIKSPSWWSQYNYVKHYRSGIFNNKHNYQYANLKNVISSLSALYILEKYIYEKIIGAIRIKPESTLFDRLEFEKRYITAAP
jgi:hypothetical protein